MKGGRAHIGYIIDETFWGFWWESGHLTLCEMHPSDKSSFSGGLPAWFDSVSSIRLSMHEAESDPRFDFVASGEDGENALFQLRGIPPSETICQIVFIGGAPFKYLFSLRCCDQV